MSARTATAMLCAIHAEVSKNPKQVLAWDDKFLEQGLGYMRPLVDYHLSGDEGARYATCTPDGRLVVIVTSVLGNVVVMDHHSDNSIVVYNAPKELNGLWDKVLQAKDIESILGFTDSDHNIGRIISAIGVEYASKCYLI